MSLPHVVIPLDRFRKLEARMTGKLPEKIPQGDQESEDSARSPRRITPVKVEPPRTPSNSAFPETKNENITSGKRNYKSDDKVEESKRTYEEILENHRRASFLPPGQRSDKSERDKSQSVKKQKKEKKHQSKKDTVTMDHKYKNGQNRKAKPYSVLTKKWISL